MKTLTFAAASLAMIATASPAFAGPAFAGESDVHSQSVRYADLNLATPEGQARLDQRIDAAAKSVCRVNEVRTGTRIRSPHVNDCLASARASAKKQVSAMMAETQRGG
ncbi:UrcA family protein [Erythrobacter sp. SCSIO 43205]|uniref:UrcA family protein n=1 Tax=Erythrobacter sp. SCSIO 43205 TaxID=2779361 RepID=UPI001CA87AF1|nr:UrcA family protein [Erythrobacter sp. SCSIO 43205]UAB78452.1 UrcA family protein [Erythrobacter sp. SCSIO 43205]